MNKGPSRMGVQCMSAAQSDLVGGRHERAQPLAGAASRLDVEVVQTEALAEEKDMVIDRCLDAPVLERVRDHFEHALKEVASGDLGIEFFVRPNGRFNLYHRGMSIAAVTVRADVDRVEIASRFCGAPGQGSIFNVAPQGLTQKGNGGRAWFAVPPSQVREFFKQANLRKLCSAVRATDFSEELALEQLIIAENRDRPEYVIVDRQVQDTASGGKEADLLALRRVEGDRYGIDVIEIKLADNRQAGKAVIKQIAGYRDHIERHFADYKAGYERQYRQRYEIGLLGQALPPDVEIVRPVRGRIIVTGFRGNARRCIEYLRQHTELNGIDVLGPLCELEP